MVRDQQSSDAPEKQRLEGESAMEKLWAEAAKSFESICGESLQRGGIHTFKDVLMQIERGDKAYANDGPDDHHRRDKARSVGLASLKYLVLFVDAAYQAPRFVCLVYPALHCTHTLTYVGPCTAIGGQNYLQCFIF